MEPEYVWFCRQGIKSISIGLEAAELYTGLSRDTCKKVQDSLLTLAIACFQTSAFLVKFFLLFTLISPETLESRGI
jgi:hypothetical protein